MDPDCTQSGSSIQQVGVWGRVQNPSPDYVCSREQKRYVTQTAFEEGTVAASVAAKSKTGIYIYLLIIFRTDTIKKKERLCDDKKQTSKNQPSPLRGRREELIKRTHRATEQHAAGLGYKCLGRLQRQY